MARTRDAENHGGQLRHGDRPTKEEFTESVSLADLARVRREIKLLDWQREICDRFPDRLLRGLIHSDGCRSINTIKNPNKTYQYPRYQFTNRSDDIRGIFCEYCDLLGIEWRQMNRWNISVARRDSVAELDRLIGPKR